MVFAIDLFASFVEQFKLDLTPPDLGHRCVEHLVRLCYEKAGHGDAEKLTHLLLAAVYTDHNELRLDVPPALQVQFVHARITFRRLLEWALDVNITSPVKLGVVDAVNQLGVALSSFADDKVAMRADGHVEKYAVVLSLHMTALRAGPAPPQAQVMWLEAAKGTAEGRAKFMSSVRNFAAVSGRRKVLDMLQVYLMGPHVVYGGELTTDLNNVAAGGMCAAEPDRLAAEGGMRACNLLMVGHGDEPSVIDYLEESLLRWGGAFVTKLDSIVVPIVSSVPRAIRRRSASSRLAWATRGSTTA